MSDNGAKNGSVGLKSLIRLSRAAFEEAGLAAPLVLSRFAAQTVLNRTSRRRTVKRVPRIVRTAASNVRDNPMTAPRGDVVIPVYNNFEDTVALLAALEADTSFQGRIIIVHDCSPDARLAPMLTAFASRMDRVALLQNPRNLGFVKSCNRGFVASREDVVILNTDITLPPGAVNRLLSRLQSAADIATVTPFSNSAYGVGLPDLLYSNAVPFGARVEAVDAALQSLMPTEPVNLATGIGFCLAMSRKTIDQLSGFDEAYGLGYGEETDFCQRAAARGYRHMLGADTYVEHKGGKSFAGTWQEKSRRGLIKVLSRHPQYVGRLRAYLDVGETRAIGLAGLVALAQRLSGEPVQILERDGDDASTQASGTNAPVLRLHSTGNAWLARISFAGENHAFSFQNRNLIGDALALCGVALNRR